MLNFLRNLCSAKRNTKQHLMTFDEAMAKLNALAMPSSRLIHCDFTSFSKLGGDPNLPIGTDWPAWKGLPLSFLGQISLAEVYENAPIDWLPAVGSLFFFYDADQSTWGFDPEDAGSWRVLYAPEGTAGPPVSPPADLPEMGRYDDWFVRFVPDVSLPDPDRAGIRYDDVEETFWTHVEERREANEPAHQIGGHPLSIQNDYMELECQLASNGICCGNSDGYDSDEATKLESGSAEWRLLFQIDSDEERSMMWGDVGRLYFWIRQNDLDRCDFSKVWMILQCH